MRAITCTRRLQFCAGHRVMGHENKCAHLHGHNWVVFLTARMANRGIDVTHVREMCERGHITQDQANKKIRELNQLDNIGRVIDFSILKERIGGWIDDQWDHGFILHGDDVAAIQALDTFISHRFAEDCKTLDVCVPARFQKTFYLPNNPTAENMANYLLRTVGPMVLEGAGVELCKVVLWETENCYAEVEL